MNTKTKSVRMSADLHAALVNVANASRPSVNVQALIDEAARRFVEDVQANGLNIINAAAPRVAEPRAGYKGKA